MQGLRCVCLLMDPLSSSDGAHEALFHARARKDISRCCQTLQYDQVFHNLSYFLLKPQLSSYIKTSASIKEKDNPHPKKKKKSRTPNQTKKSRQSNNETLQKPPPLFRHTVLKARLQVLNPRALLCLLRTLQEPVRTTLRLLPVFNLSQWAR